MKVHLLVDGKTACGANPARVTSTRAVASVSCASCRAALGRGGLRTSPPGLRKKRPQGTRQRPKGTTDVRLLAAFHVLDLSFRGTYPRGERVGSWPGDVWAEYEFSDTRKFRLDFALPVERIAIEIHGGKYVTRESGHQGGSHHSISGRKRDMIKARIANLEGWTYGEFDYDDLDDGSFLEWLEAAYESKRVVPKRD